MKKRSANPSPQRSARFKKADSWLDVEDTLHTGPDPQHVFKNMHSRLPIHVLRAVDALLPDKDASHEESLQAYAAVSKVHEKFFKEEWQKDAEAPCIKHERMCPVYGQTRRRIRFHSSGVTCTDWSSFGSAAAIPEPLALDSLVGFTLRRRDSQSGRQHTERSLCGSVAAVCAQPSLSPLIREMAEHKVLA